MIDTLIKESHEDAEKHVDEEFFMNVLITCMVDFWYDDEHS